MLLLSPPFLKTKTGAPFVVFDPPPRTTTVNKNTGILLFPFSYTSHFHLLLKHKILAKLLPRLLRGLHRYSRLAFKLEDSIVGGGTYSLNSCPPLQFLETKTGAPLVVLHPPPVKMLLLSPPFLKTKTGAPFVVFDPPPQNNNSQQKHWNFAISLFLYKSLPSFAQTQDPSQTLT